MIKYVSFIAAGLPSWTLGLIFISMTDGFISFYIQSAIFIFLSINLNFIVVRTFVFKGNERGRDYFIFLSSVAIFRVFEYLCSLFLFTITNIPIFSLLFANFIISIFKFRFLTIEENATSKIESGSLKK
ncbi:hypothetical protein OAW28_05065 [Alphaproteobacteria bacterium]|nr:hypothetical protein [Alphaproteobacteria bacterium]